MATNKLRMSNKRFMAILIPVLVLLFALTLVVTLVMNYWTATLDTYLGRGERLVSNPKNTENWDKNYYPVLQKDGKNINTLDYAAEVSKEISDEGTILLKNNGVLPLAKNSGVAPFGARYRFPIFGGTGSGKVNTTDERVWQPDKGLKKYFNVNAAVEQIINNSTPWRNTNKQSGEAAEYLKPGDASSHFSGADTGIYEFDAGVYDPAANSIDKSRDVGIVYIGRIGGEGDNPKATEYDDGTPHYFSLSKREMDTVKFAKEHCKAVVAVINSSNIMELGAIMAGEFECDAIVWIGGPGSTGFESLSDVLVGDVNPSGRTVDIWVSDILQNPTMQNFGNRFYSNTGEVEIWKQEGKDPGIFFYEYEEGVYYGYRFYETADVVDQNFTYGKLTDQGGIETAGKVLYPFGYGLSYSSFEQNIKSFKDNGNQVEVEVDVKNIGNKAGKEVVQLYFTAPYTEFDKQYEIEKPGKVLTAFTKTDVIEAGKSQTVKLSFAKEDMASYCYTRNNPDGTKGCYVLEEGDYAVSLGKNSHDVWDTRTVGVGSTIWYDNTHPRQSETDAQSKYDNNGNSLGFPAGADANKDAKFIAATNRFDDINKYMHTDATILSRKDWNGTFPKAPEGEKTLSLDRKNRVISYDVKNDPLTGNVKSSVWYKEEAPLSKQKNNLSFADMRGVGYHETIWDDYLDQLDYSQTSALLLKAAYGYAAVESIDLPNAANSDGPQGFGKTGTDSKIGSFAYVAETVVSSTWNIDLAYKYGEAIGQEALYLGIQGWYGPGLNIHRSPYNGRNFEYYSEDPVLSGMLGAKCISGAEQQGLVVYSKHFGVNDHEQNSTQLCSWMTEQAYRETDLRAFEIAFKNARHTIKYIADTDGNTATKVVVGASAAMATDALLGTDIQGTSYALITELLRGEWGFNGLVMTDMFLYKFDGVNDKVLRAGTDLKMYFIPGKFDDENSATSLHLQRNAMKHVVYAYANSNLTQGAAPGAIVSWTMSPWRIGLIIADVVLGIVIVAGIVWVVLRSMHCKKHPELYIIGKK